MTEASLIAAAKSGESRALDVLYQTHAEKLLHTVRGITRNHEDAEDAVQDCFLSAFLHLKSFDGRSTFRTWLTRIGINSALMILRRKRNSREVPAQRGAVGETLWDVTDTAPSPERRYAKRELQQFVREAIADLRPRIRRAVELHALHEHSLQETAAEIGISVAATKGRLFHARAALRKSKMLRGMRNRHEHRPKLACDGVRWN